MSKTSGATFEEVQIPVPWGIISGKLWGPKNKQPVVAVHGWLDNAGTWDNLIPLLPSDLAILCIDFPGHGRSSHLPLGIQYYLFWEGIVVIRRIVKHYGWDKVTLLGHSLGGAICFMYAACFPDETDGFVSIDFISPILWSPAKVANLTRNAIDDSIAAEKMKREHPSFDYDDMINIVINAREGSVTKESAKILLKRGKAPSPDSDFEELYYFTRDVRLKSAFLGFLSMEQVLEYAKKITCRVLYVRALSGMECQKPEYATSVLEKVRETADVEYIEVEGTHHVHLNNPERISEHIAKFLSR